MDAYLNQEQRQQFSKQISSVVWMIRVDSAAKEDDLATKDYAYVAGVCMSPVGHILTSAHVVKPGVKYVGACTSWKAGWTPLRVVKTSMAYGMCLCQLEHESRKKTDYTNLAESGLLSVNQHVYGFGHPNLFKIPCDYSFVRGSVEYPCKDISELPSLNDLDRLLYEAIKEFLKEFDLMPQHVDAPSMAENAISDQTPTAEPAPASVATTETVDGSSEQHTLLGKGVDALFHICMHEVLDMRLSPNRTSVSCLESCC
uniref:Uncharacterized protein n=1 Tax=Oryza sativa subsp. japonica TaxID=39947 RepID=Q75HP0_ORYSJ|nr:hypothetical protein LOC_Os03g41280 [Oryza sativa Japonica Group]